MQADCRPMCQHVRTAADVLVGQRLAKTLGRRGHGAAQQQAQLGQEGLPEAAPLLLQPARSETPQNWHNSRLRWDAGSARRQHATPDNAAAVMRKQHEPSCRSFWKPRLVTVRHLLPWSPHRDTAPHTLPAKLAGECKAQVLSSITRQLRLFASSGIHRERQVAGRAALVRVEVVELLLRILQALCSAAVLPLQQRHDGGHILQVPAHTCQLTSALL